MAKKEEPRRLCGGCGKESAEAGADLCLLCQLNEEPCPACGGTGSLRLDVEAEPLDKCPACGGTGMRMDPP